MKKAHRFCSLSLRLAIAVVLTVAAMQLIVRNRQVFSDAPDSIPYIIMAALVILSMVIVYLGTSHKERKVLLWCSFGLAAAAVAASYALFGDAGITNILKMTALGSGMVGLGGLTRSLFQSPKAKSGEAVRDAQPANRQAPPERTTVSIRQMSAQDHRMFAQESTRYNDRFKPAHHIEPSYGEKKIAGGINTFPGPQCPEPSAVKSAETSAEEHAGGHTTKFCKRLNKPVELNESGGPPTCIPHCMDIKCLEANCRYTLGGAMRSKLLGSPNVAGLYDYTVELPKGNSPKREQDKGISLPCDICSKPVIYEDCYLLHTDTVLASGQYIDMMIRKWERDGFFPSEFLSRGITDEIREIAKRDIVRQAGGTPWRVCSGCIFMFVLDKNEKIEAKELAKQHWDGKKAEGLLAEKPDTAK